MTSLAEAFIVRLAQALADTKDVKVVDVKDRALMIEVDGHNLMVGVVECK